MKINNNRDCGMQAQGYFESTYEQMPEAKECCMKQEMMGEAMPGVVCPPIYECPQETVCHRYICHEVPQE